MGEEKFKRKLNHITIILFYRKYRKCKIKAQANL